MDHRERIISEISQTECKRVSRRVIRGLQKITNALYFGDGVLKNTWDEICVQAQGPLSIYWDDYVATIERYIETEIEKLDRATKQAIWLQTDAGVRWEDNPEEDIAPYYISDITSYILHDYVLTAAGNWENERIRQFLD